MESIYFEKQEGSLCAQHCLNALLQGPYFTAVDLAMHAKTLDDEERIRMAESGEDTDEFRKFLQQPSGNMDDSGYFSVQVIASCLSVWGLELVRYGSSEPKAVTAQKTPELMKAYICNYKDHWFTIRKLAHQWFNLNSLSSGPKLVSDTYLGLFLAQLQQEGYSIFVVLGDFPQCDADVKLRTNPVKATSESYATAVSKPSGSQVKPFEGKGYRLGGEPSTNSDDNDELQRALQMSLLAEANHTEENGEDLELRKAIELSLRNASHHSSVSSGGTSSLSKPSSEEAEDPDLQKALSMSLECEESKEVASNRKVDRPEEPEALRNKRLAFFEKNNKNTTAPT